MEGFLIKKLVQRDEKAIAAFIAEHQDVVFKTCMGYLQDYDDASDVAQETFIKAIQNIKNFKAKSSVKTRLVRIAINLSLNYLRDNKKRKLAADISEMGNVLPDEQANIHELMANTELANTLRKAIYALPERQKEVFVMFYYNDMSYKEIASQMDISVSALESLLMRAKKKLQLLLKEVYEEKIS